MRIMDDSIWTNKEVEGKKRIKFDGVYIWFTFCSFQNQYRTQPYLCVVTPNLPQIAIAILEGKLRKG